MKTKMVVNVKKENIKDTFDFLVKYSWFLSNPEGYRWYSSPNGYVNVDNYSIRDFFTTDAPLASNREYIDIVRVTNNPKRVLEKYPHASKECEEGNLALKFEIVQFLKREINGATNYVKPKDNGPKHQRVSGTLQKKLVVLKEYIELLKQYEDDMKKDYNARTEEEKCILVQANPDVIYVLDNPTFTIQKEAYKAYFKKGMISDKGNDYFTEQTGEVIVQYRNEAICPGSDYTEEEYQIGLIRMNPVCALAILKEPVSKRVVNEALRVFPELLFYSNWNLNKKQLLLNSTVYDILDSDLGKQNCGNPIVREILEKNITLVKSDKGLGTEEDLRRSNELLQSSIVSINQDSSLIKEYIEDAAQTGKTLVKE